MAKEYSRFGFTPQEQRISALPSAIAGILILVFIVVMGITTRQGNPVFLLGFGIIGTIYLMIFNFLIVPYLNFEPALGWMNAIVSAIGIALLNSFLPGQFDIYLGFLAVTLVTTCALISGRIPSYLLILFVFLLVVRGDTLDDLGELIQDVSLTMVAAIAVETIMQLKESSRDHTHRLETITNFSRAIASTLQTNQVMTLLNAAFQNSIEADTYFVGIREGDNEMRLELLHDDGEFYENQRVNLEGSLSGWVLKNQQSLFLPDLRKEITLPGVRLVLVGRHKTSLSWMGVPMRGETVDGIIAISSYHPNAFERADLELLTALAQHAAQAIDNTYRHAQVELQSQLDSLTDVYNHGHFLKLLKEQTDQTKRQHQPLSVIMLDIDHFKQYNDKYGHLAGDEILKNLCSIIKGHLKRTDAVGRWGGEEFVISLPSANGKQAHQIAKRIRTSMLKLSLHNYNQKTIPVPTVSQGIAVYPLEADEVMKLIDLADKRLYVAKERGRNQVEPDENHWESLYSNQDQ
jgi:diguanylate cyclase (GGDEF)-like protein